MTSPIDEMQQGRPIRRFQVGALSRDTAATVATGGTITHDGHPRVRLTTAGAVTGVILQAGLYDGQMLVLQNESANTITMAAVATSRVANGATFVVVALGAALLFWDNVAAVWTGIF